MPRRVAPAEAAPQPLKALPGETVTVKVFRFSGNTLLTAEQLAPAVAPYLGRPISFAELQGAAAAIADAYREAGWVVRAYLPSQDIVDGMVTIQIIEAVFGGVRLDGTPSVRVPHERVLGAIDAAQGKGQPLNANKLDRAILLLDDLPGITVAGTLRKGEGENETDIGLKTADEPWVNGEVGADNTGARSTGAQRLTGGLYINSPLRVGDQVTANLIHSSGTDYGRLGYSIPVGYDGWRVGISGSSLRYKLVADEFKSLDAKGSSSTVGLEASYPIIRSRMQNLYLGLNADNKQFDNEANRATTTRYRIQAYSIGLNGNLFDKLGGGGANAAGITLTRGAVDLGQLDASENPRLQGNFTKLNYRLSRQQAITDSLSAYAMVSGQTARNNLDSAEKFYLGGANGVRAYPANEGGGDDGQMLNLELRARLPYNFNLTGFYDLGRVTVNRDNTANAAPNNFTLKGGGVSVAWLTDFGLNLKATWARRIGNNPNPTATGADQDGSLRKNRFWLSASIAF